jgi:glycosyltransferase involved in cell wall biosynthesis
MTAEPVAASEKGLVIVTPWFGTAFPGGAERLARSLAERMAARGWRVALAATTNAAHHGWWEESNFAPGRHPWPPFEAPSATAEASPFPPPELWRFPPDPRHRRAYDQINHKLLHGMPIRLEEEEEFFRNSINSRALLAWITRERPRDLVAILPYPFGLSFFATVLFGERAVLIPCLHREGYAATRLVAEMLERPGGLVFLSEEEQALARALADVSDAPQIVAGVGVEGPEGPPSDEERAQARAKFSEGEPYLLYLGWQDPAKGVSFLYECCRDLVRLHREGFFRGPAPRLLLAGPGHAPIPPGLAGKAFDLRYLSPEDKRLALAGAEWLVHPSARESFGIALMEAWLAETPALVNALCATTRGPCRPGRRRALLRQRRRTRRRHRVGPREPRPQEAHGPAWAAIRPAALPVGRPRRAL